MRYDHTQAESHHNALFSQVLCRHHQVLQRICQNTRYYQCQGNRIEQDYYCSTLQNQRYYLPLMPGDIVGIPDTGNFKIGDTLTSGEQLHFKGLPSFSPEMFKYIENTDPMKSKQLEKGIQQLMDEGVAQLFVNQFNVRKIIGTVGQLQFEVIQYRLLNEYGAQCRWEPISLYKACWIESDDIDALNAFKKRKHQFMAIDREVRDVFLADSNYVLQMAQSDFPQIKFHFTSEF